MSLMQFASILLFMVSCAQANTKSQGEAKSAVKDAVSKPVTSKKYSEELLSDCNKLTHSEWIKKYSDAEDEVLQDLKKNPKLSNAGEQKEYFEILFPQDLPKSHAMKGAFVGCFEIFSEYQSAINNVQSMSALKRLESCYQDAYKIDPPKVLGQYMDCLKSIKY